MFLQKGMPDTIYFFSSYTFFLESKIHPNKPSKIQLAQIKRIRQWGGYAWIVTFKNGIILLDEMEFETIPDIFGYIKEYIRNEISKKICI